MDKKFVPYTEIENLYKFVYERRKANSLYKSHHSAVQKELEGFDKGLYAQVEESLKKSNKTLYEASNGLNALYINAMN